MAFQDCRSLREVTLCEGVHEIGGDAFTACTFLEHINIPPAAFVIDVQGGRCQLMRNAMTRIISGRTVVVSEWEEYGGGAVQEWHQSARRIRVAPNVAVSGSKSRSPSSIVSPTPNLDRIDCLSFGDDESRVLDGR